MDKIPTMVVTTELEDLTGFIVVVMIRSQSALLELDSVMTTVLNTVAMDIPIQNKATVVPVEVMEVPMVAMVAPMEVAPMVVAPMVVAPMVVAPMVVISL